MRSNSEDAQPAEPGRHTHKHTQTRGKEIVMPHNHPVRKTRKEIAVAAHVFVSLRRDLNSQDRIKRK